MSDLRKDIIDWINPSVGSDVLDLFKDESQSLTREQRVRRFQELDYLCHSYVVHHRNILECDNLEELKERVRRFNVVQECIHRYKIEERDLYKSSHGDLLKNYDIPYVAYYNKELK